MQILKNQRCWLRFLGLLSHSGALSLRDIIINVVVAAKISALFFGSFVYIVQNIRDIQKVTGALFVLCISLFNFTCYATTAFRKKQLTDLLTNLQEMVNERETRFPFDKI